MVKELSTYKCMKLTSDKNKSDPNIAYGQKTVCFYDVNCNSKQIRGNCNMILDMVLQSMKNEMTHKSQFLYGMVKYSGIILAYSVGDLKQLFFFFFGFRSRSGADNRMIMFDHTCICDRTRSIEYDQIKTNQT